MNALDTVLFDLGNVLVAWDPRVPLSAELPPDEVERFLEASAFRELNHRLDAGLPWDDAEAELAARDPAAARALRVYRDGYARALTGPVPGMTELVGDLRGAGLRLVGLTNWSAETWPLALPAAPLIRLLHGVVVSGVEGLAKPDPRVFALAAERYGLDPACTVFVDDSPVNVAAAAGLGYDALVFTGAGDLRRDLAARGVPVGP